MNFSFDQNRSLGYLAGLTSRLLRHLLVVRFLEAGIDMTAEQWGAIVILLNGGVMSQGDLGEKLCLEKSSVSRLTNGLEKRGWIERTRDTIDSRKKLITPTPLALEMAEHCTTIVRGVLEDAQLGMSEDERSFFRSLLTRVIKNVQGLIG